MRVLLALLAVLPVVVQAQRLRCDRVDTGGEIRAESAAELLPIW